MRTIKAKELNALGIYGKIHNQDREKVYAVSIKTGEAIGVVTLTAPLETYSEDELIDCVRDGAGKPRSRCFYVTREEG